MKRLDYLFLVLLIVASCSRSSKVDVIASADDLVAHIGGEVCAEGSITHVCGVGNNKMKLILADNTVVVVIPGSSSMVLTKEEWTNKHVKVCGELSQRRVSKQYLDSMYTAQQLLCSLDYTLCTDTAWVHYQWTEGNAEKILAAESIRLNKQMEKTGQNYVPVYTITAKSIVEVEPAEKK